MVYSILLIISICLTPVFGSNILEGTLEKKFPGSISRRIPLSESPVAQIDIDFSPKYCVNEGLRDKISSVLSIAKRTEGEKFYPIRLAGEIIELDETKSSYAVGESGLDVFDKIDIIYYLAMTSSKDLKIRSMILCEQCSGIITYEMKVNSLWARSYDPDPDNVHLNYPQFLDDLRDQMLTHIKILDDLRNKTLNDSKPARRYSEPNKRVSFSLFSAPDAPQRATSDQYSYIDFVKRRFSYGQGNKESHPPK